MNEPKTKNTLADLRNHLFATLEDLRDRDSGMDVARARAICDVSGRIIDSAKVEVEMVRAIGASEPASKRFFSLPEESRELPARVVGRIEGK